MNKKFRKTFEIEEKKDKLINKNKIAKNLQKTLGNNENM